MARSLTLTIRLPLRWGYRHAFTLVELLVVIGIIALLISILLPALSKAMAQSKQVQCLSNVRQLATALTNYAAENQDQIPLGYNSGNQRRNITVYNADGQLGPHNTPSSSPIWGQGMTIICLGLLYPGIISDGRTYYCPSVEDDPTRMYNTPDNPWNIPVDQYLADGTTINPAAQLRWNEANTGTGLPGSTFIGYGCRPVANFGRQPFPIVLNPKTGLYQKGAFPRLSQMKNKAILADSVTNKNTMTDLSDVLMRHKTGVNVIFADGSGSFVPLTVFKTDFLNLPLTGNFSDTPVAQFLDETTNPNAPTGIWADFDAYHDGVQN